MLARKVLDLAEKQGLLDAKAIVDLRRAVAESKFVVTPEAIAKVLVDHGHLTPFQARKLVNEALGPDPEPPPSPVRPRPRMPDVELTLAEDEDSPPPAAASVEDEIVELEAVQPAPRSKPETPPKKPSAGKAKAPKSPVKPAPMKPPEEEDLVPLEIVPLTAVPARRPHAPLSPVPAAQLQPLSVLTPLPDLFPADSPLSAGPTSPLAAPSGAQPVMRHRPAKNVWDSPFLLVGGGLLGLILVIFGVLFYSLTRGTAAELFNKAEEEYRNGAYASAIAGYDTFLDRYAADPNASLARVRRIMAQLRQVSDDGKNPRLALQSAQQLLPQIETEPRFQDARTELASLLPEIADGLATLAGQSQEMKKKEELVKLAGAAMELVNNPLYLPASLRKEREQRIAAVLDKLKVADRSIQQDRDLIAAIEKMTTAIGEGRTSEAYRVRAELLRTYPSAESSPELHRVTLAAGEKERQLVKVSQPGTAAATDDPGATPSPVVIATREGPEAASADPHPVFVLVEGAVYGLDLANGRVLWRRFVGFETTAQPVLIGKQTSADVLVLDGRNHELLRLKGSTGKLVWRQPLGEPAAEPVVAGEQVFVSTQNGRLVEIEATSGKLAHAAQLPQGAIFSSAVDAREGRPSRLLQLGEHSTLFVLAADTLACAETCYLGHKAGAIFVPPVAVLDQVLVCESPADDYTLIRVLSPEAKTKRLAELTQFRLKGRIVTPLATSHNRVAAITDIGQIAVYEVDPTNVKQPVRLIVGAEGTESAPLTPYFALDGNRLWLANKWCKLLELQPTVSQLAHKWTEDRGDTFVSPLQILGDTLVHVRRRPAGAAVSVEAASATTGKPIWTTHLAAPVAALSTRRGSQSVDLLTAEGRVFTLTTGQLSGGCVDRPAFQKTEGSNDAIALEVSHSADGLTLLWTDAHAGGHIYSYVYNAGQSAAPVATPLPEGGEASGPPQVLGGKLLLPLAGGSVVLLESGSGKQVAQAFVPTLTPGLTPRWTRPIVQADNAGFVIGDGRGAIYCVALKSEPRPRLVATAELKTDGPVVALAPSANGTAFGILRGDKFDSLVGFNAKADAAFEPMPFQGRVTAGPFAVGPWMLVAAEPDGLTCLDGAGKRQWQVPLERGPLAAPVLACENGDLLAIHRSGAVNRLDSASGKVLAGRDIGQPLGKAACIIGRDVLLVGSDGVLHEFPFASFRPGLAVAAIQ